MQDMLFGQPAAASDRFGFRPAAGISLQWRASACWNAGCEGHPPACLQTAAASHVGPELNLGGFSRPRRAGIDIHHRCTAVCATVHASLALPKVNLATTWIAGPATMAGPQAQRRQRQLRQSSKPPGNCRYDLRLHWPQATRPLTFLTHYLRWRPYAPGQVTDDGSEWGHEGELDYTLGSEISAIRWLSSQPRLGSNPPPSARPS